MAIHAAPMPAPTTAAPSKGAESPTKRARIPRLIVQELREAWWIYVLVPPLLTVFRAGTSGSDWAITYIVNLCATLCIGGSIQTLLVVSERRGWSLPWNLQYGLLVLVGVLVGTELTFLVLGTFATFDRGAMRWGMWTIGGSVAAAVATIGVTYDRLRAHARTVELREEQARRKALQAELDALHSRMNPHFLFNSLNTVAALIEEDAEAAVDAVERLSDLLRYTLERDAASTVPLADELQCVREYLAIEGLRFGERLRVEWALDEGVEAGAWVPPLSLQPLVENAVKHGVSRSRTPVTVRLQARRVGDQIALEVCDDGPGSAPRSMGSKGTGTALRTLSERLRLLYGEAARFEAGVVEGGGYRAALSMPARLDTSPESREVRP